MLQKHNYYSLYFVVSLAWRFYFWEIDFLNINHCHSIIKFTTKNYLDTRQHVVFTVLGVIELFLLSPFTFILFRYPASCRLYSFESNWVVFTLTLYFSEEVEVILYSTCRFVFDVFDITTVNNQKYGLSAKLTKQIILKQFWRNLHKSYTPKKVREFRH